MLKARIIPCLDVKDGRVVKGVNFVDLRDAGDPVQIAKAYDALPEGGAFIAIEQLIDDARRENAFGLLMSLNMLIETPGGFDYTGADCIGWVKEAGFKDAKVVQEEDEGAN